MALTKYKVVAAPGVNALLIAGKRVELKDLTDEQAAVLVKNGSRYVEEINPSAAKPGKVDDKKE